VPEITVDTAVEITDLRFSWAPGKPILSVEKFQVPSSESVFIRGPSGSGKSTLLNLLGGVIKPDSGSIKLLGQDITGLKASQVDHFRADHTGYIFQQFNLLPYLSVIENILLPCQFSKKRSLKAQEMFQTPEMGALYLLQRMGFTESLINAKSVLELSTGQQQRVAAARALLGAPELVVADEPTSALDSDHRDQFIELILEQCRAQSSTLLFVSHDTSLEKHFDHRISLKPSQAGGYKL
jgi:putative ABC transport system ATP-binding protein